MDVVLIMALGVLLGLRWVPVKFSRLNLLFQTVCTALLIFSMGVGLGSRPDFFEQLAALGWDSLVLALIPMFFSAVFVFFLTRNWKGGRHGPDRDS